MKYQIIDILCIVGTNNPAKDKKYLANDTHEFLNNKEAQSHKNPCNTNVYHMEYPIIDHSYHIESHVIQTVLVSQYSICAQNYHMKFNVIQISDFKLPRQLQSPSKIRSNEI